MTKRIIRRDHSREHKLLESMHPVLRRIYSARNITGPGELDTSLGMLTPYQSLLGIDRAAALITEAISGRQRILILADYDADGATGCALLLRGLRLMGAADVQYLVPSRFDYGYGMSPEIVRVAATMSPDLMITVDNGISSLDGVRLARSLGINVLVTDHHLPREELPEANVIVNPNQPGDEFPSKHIAGVGVVFYVLAAVRAALRSLDWFDRNNIREPNLAVLLDLVALGTVADVVPLDFNNRVLVAQGLERIRSGRGNPGISALLAVARRNPSRITAADLGFAVAPRLNAAGRLEDMSLGIECLLSDDPVRAMAMAQRLDELNRERREIQREMLDLAEPEMAALDLGGELPYGLCLFKEGWHQGVIGIVAARIKDRWNRPVIAFAPDRDGLLRGSARSVAEVHIRDVLAAITSREPRLVEKFGGHARAAGLTIRRDVFEQFSAVFDAEVRRHLSPEDLAGAIITDGALDGGELTLNLAEAISAAGPWGQEFPEPSFDGVFTVTGRRIVGEKHLKLTLQTSTCGPFDAIAFGMGETDLAGKGESVRAVYRLSINEYNGSRKLQLITEYLESAEARSRS